MSRIDRYRLGKSKLIKKICLLVNRLGMPCAIIAGL
jgi:hypothetical protein